MSRTVPVLVLAAVFAAAGGSTSRGQWGFPGGFGDFGWGGWGATTAAGDEARGLGMFAAGMGQYNAATAGANAINTDTVMRFNEYMYQSQQLRNERFWQQRTARRQRVNLSREIIFDRLRNAPERRDIHRGDALNVLLDEVTAPMRFPGSVSAGRATLTPDQVREIRFNFAPQAVTISLEELAGAMPEALRDAAYAKEREAMAVAIERAQIEADEDGRVSVETLRELRDAIRAFRTRLMAELPSGARRTEALNFLKANYGLARMLETPDLSNFLSSLNNVQTVSVGELLAFMTSFNLRFGVAREPRQRAVYEDLFVKLRAVAAQVDPNPNVAAFVQAPRELHPESATAFFSSMNFDEIQEPRPLQPAAVAPAR
jgi:hypothetical protein